METQNSFSLTNELKRLGKHGATYGVAQVLSRLIGFILIPIYTHHLNPTDYGILQLVGISIEIVGIILSLGIGDAVYRFYYDTNIISERNQVISTAFVSVALIGAPVIAGLSLLSWKAAGVILESSNQGIYIFLALCTLWCNTISQLFFTYLRVKERSSTYLMISILRTAASLLLIVYFLVFLKKGVLGIFQANLIISSALCLLSAVFIIHRIGIGFSFTLLNGMLRYSLPIIPANLASFIVNASDRYFIRGYLSISDAGIYTLGYRLGNMVHYLIRTPFMEIWAPRRFALFREEAPPEAFAKIATFFIGLMIFCALGISIFVHDVIKIISPFDYWSAGKYTPAVALCYIVYSLDNHVALGILISKKTEYWSYVNFAMAGLNLSLNYFLISNYGIWGAVASTFGSLVFKITALHLIAKRFFTIPFEWFRMLGMLLIASFIYFLSKKFHPDSLWVAFAWDAFMLSAFAPILWFLGLIKTNEKETFRRMLRTSFPSLKMKAAQ